MAESPNLPTTYNYDSPTAPELSYEPLLEAPTLGSSSAADHDHPPQQNEGQEQSGAVSPRVQPPVAEDDYTIQPPAPAAALPLPSASSVAAARPSSQPPPSAPGRATHLHLHPPKKNFPVPERIPGELVQDPEKHWQLRGHLARLCGIKGTARFPGSQPVSFDLHSLQLLETEDFWVCEKSDGVRVLVLIVATGFGQETYL
ncbi:hypothetical protein JCM1841_001201, partial [Sporobolomyces salmonicolor]